MTGAWSGLPHATGPLAAPSSAAFVTACGCDGEVEICARHDGSRADDREIDAAYQQAAWERARLMRNREYRRTWEASLPAAFRDDMIAAANRTYGVLVEELEGGAAA